MQPWDNRPWEDRSLKFGCLVPLGFAVAGALLTPLVIWGSAAYEEWNVAVAFFMLFAIPMFFVALFINDGIDRARNRALDRWHEENWDQLSDFERQTYLADRIAAQTPTPPPPGWANPNRRF